MSTILDLSKNVGFPTAHLNRNTGFKTHWILGGDQHVPIHSGYLLQEAVERFIQQDSQSRTGDERRGGTHFSQAFWVMIIAVCLEMGRLSLNEWQFEKGHWRFKPLGFSTSTEKSEK